MTYTPKPGTLVASVVDFFAKNPEEELSLPDIAQKWDVDSRGVHASLHGAIINRVLVRTGGNYHAGPQLRSAATPAMPPPSRATKPRKAAPPPLDLEDIAVVADVPLPSRAPTAKRTQWPVLLARLDKPGLCSAPLPAEYRTSLNSAAKRWAKDNPGFAFALRQVSDTHIRIWRTA